MKFLFSTNEKWYSKAHRYITGEPFTHVGILFFEGGANIVVECTKPAGKASHADHWNKKYQTVEKIDFPLLPRDETHAYADCIFDSLDVPYDWGAYYYAWIAGLKKYLFNCPYPEKNKWSGNGRWCTEVAGSVAPYLKGFYGVDISDLQLDAMTPYMLYKALKVRGNMY